MTISSSLNAGVAGLTANATRLATISDNIANSATHGYKTAETSFHSMFSSGSGSYSAGGVRVTTSRQIDQPGAMLSTSNATDLAVRGRGFLPVTTASALGSGESNDYPMYLATTGSFRTDAEGFLVTQAGQVLLGWPANQDGSIPLFPRDTSDGLEPVRLNSTKSSGAPTTEITLGVNLPAAETDTGASGEILQTSIEYYDNVGASRQLIVEYEAVPNVAPGVSRSNEWIMRVYDNAVPDPITGDPLQVGEYDITFDDTTGSGGSIASVTTVSGGAYDPLTGSFEVNVERGPLNITIGMIGSTTGSGLSQVADSFAPTAIQKNGSQVGTMVSVEVDANGFVYGNFDTGVTRTLYQIPLVDLPNPNGLNVLDNQTYSISNSSGAFYLWDAGAGPTGDVIGFALEESATDVAGELTNLIQTQRAYSSNAKVIQTVDEMLQETTNIKR